MTKQTRTPHNIVDTLFTKGYDQQDITLDWNAVAKPLAYELNVWLEAKYNTPMSLRGVTYKRFLGLIGSKCIIEMKDAEGNPIEDWQGNPRKHFSSKQLCKLFSKSKLKEGKLELLPKVFKDYKKDGLNIS